MAIAAIRSSPRTRRGRIPRRAGATLRLRVRTLLRQAAATAAEVAITPRAATAAVEGALAPRVATAVVALRGVMEAEGEAITAEAAPAAALTPAVEVATRAVVEGGIVAVGEARTLVVAAIRIANRIC